MRITHEPQHIYPRSEHCILSFFFFFFFLGGWSTLIFIALAGTNTAGSITLEEDAEAFWANYSFLYLAFSMLHIQLHISPVSMKPRERILDTTCPLSCYCRSTGQCNTPSESRRMPVSSTHGFITCTFEIWSYSLIRRWTIQVVCCTKLICSGMY